MKYGKLKTNLIQCSLKVSSQLMDIKQKVFHILSAFLDLAFFLLNNINSFVERVYSWPFTS